MTMFAKWFYGFSPERIPIITFSHKGSRDSLLRNSEPRDLIAFVATKGDEAAEEDRGRVLGAAEIGGKEVRTEEVVDTSTFPARDFIDSKIRWPKAIPMLRAWRFDPPPLANEVFRAGNLPPHAQVHAVRLSDVDEAAIRSLNWKEVELAPTKERQRQRRLSDAFSGQPTRPGPVVRPGTYTSTVSEKEEEWTYAARFGTSPIWKIGHTSDLDQRMRDIDAHIPVEYLEERWSIGWRQKWPTTDRAREMEQRLLTILVHRRTQGEMVKCGEDEIRRAWIEAIAGT